MDKQQKNPSKLIWWSCWIIFHLEIDHTLAINSFKYFLRSSSVSWHQKERDKKKKKERKIEQLNKLLKIII